MNRSHVPAASAILLVLVLVGFADAQGLTAEEKALQDAIAEADRLDPGWRSADLQARRAIIPDEENAALHIIAVKKKLPADWPSWKELRVAGRKKSNRDPAWYAWEFLERLDERPPARLNEQEIRALEGVLKEAGDALPESRKLANMPRGRYPLATSGNVPYLPYNPHGPNARQIADLLSYDVLLRAERNDVVEAVLSCQAMMRCVSSFGDEPGLQAMLIRLGIRWKPCYSLERILTQGEASEADLARLQQLLEKEEATPLLLQAARGDRADLDEYLLALFAAREWMSLNQFASVLWANAEVASLLPNRSTIIKHRAATLRMLTAYVELTKQPLEKYLSLWEKLEHFPLDEKIERVYPTRPVLKIQMRVFLRSQAKLRSTIVMVALERFRLAHGRWPDSLAGLTPKFISRVPLDPYFYCASYSRIGFRRGSEPGRGSGLGRLGGNFLVASYQW